MDLVMMSTLNKLKWPLNDKNTPAKECTCYCQSQWMFTVGVAASVIRTIMGKLTPY